MSAGQGAEPARSRDILTLYRKSAAFTRGLLHENQRLRRQIADAETRQRIHADDPTLAARLRGQLLTCVESMEESKQEILGRLREIESRSRKLAKRSVEIDASNNNLIHLYVALDRLHSTLDLSQVLETIVQIAVNLIGAEVLAIYVLDEKTGKLVVVAAQGENPDAFPSFELGVGVVGTAVAMGRTLYYEARGPVDPSRPIACIPLRAAGSSIGAVAIHRLLRQKEDFTPLDHELFTLLAGHAATAISAARAYSQSRRRLDTMRGFLDLLTS
jgi:hypothetical protein